MGINIQVYTGKKEMDIRIKPKKKLERMKGKTRNCLVFKYWCIFLFCAYVA